MHFSILSCTAHYVHLYSYAEFSENGIDTYLVYVIVRQNYVKNNYCCFLINARIYIGMSLFRYNSIMSIM